MMAHLKFLSDVSVVSSHSERLRLERLLANDVAAVTLWPVFGVSSQFLPLGCLLNPSLINYNSPEMRFRCKLG